MDIKSNIITLFSMVRTMFEGDVVMQKKLNEEYENSVIKRLSTLDRKYSDKINKVFVLIIGLVESLDFEKFSDRLHGVSFNIDSYSMAYDSIVSSFSAIEKTYAKGLLQDLRLLFACLDQVVYNPAKYAKNMALLKENQNDIL